MTNHRGKRLFITGIPTAGKSYLAKTTPDIRNIENPRWGKTAHLQQIEAKTFFFVERPRYAIESEKCDYPIFQTADEAFEPTLALLT